MTKDTIFLLALTFFTVLIWIGFEVYRAKTRLYLPEVVHEMTLPLDADIDLDTIAKLKLRN